MSRSSIRVFELSQFIANTQQDGYRFIAIVLTPSGRAFERRYSERPSEFAVRTAWKNDRKTFKPSGK